ncbi:MAG TPA: DUF2169 domain-containing protein [Planctomycetota bacterium]|nr:DUF2169 domain-containing protein [Planctomycetota bacterium]
MKYVNATPFPVAVLPGKVRPPEWSATLIVKGSFALKPGAPAQPLAKPVDFMGDVHRDEDPAQDCSYDSDFAPWKQNADVLLVGSCHAPGGKPTTACRVDFGVGSWAKSLAVIGNRQWKKTLLVSSPSDPEPFTRIPLTYGNAYGGDGFAKNPAGRGFEKFFLPNLEPLEGRITSPGDRPDPAGFGPLSRTWPQRARKLGSYRGKYLKERWPHFPQDFDFTYFNAAPEDQQLRKYLKGDEELRFENLHPKVALYRSALPGLRFRAFLSEKLKAGPRFREVPLNLDTLYVDMDQELLVLVWRGLATVQSEDLTEIEHAVVASEPLKDPPAPPERFQALLPKPAPASAAAPPPAAPAPKPPGPLQLKLKAGQEDAQKLEAAHLEGAKALAQGAGLDLEAALAKPPAGLEALHASLVAWKGSLEKMGAPVPPFLEAQIAAVAPGGAVAEAEKKFQSIPRPPKVKPPVTLEALKAAVARPGGLKAQEKDLSGANLAGADLSGMDLTDAILKDADLSGAKLVKTVLCQAQLSTANLSGADLSGAILEGADLSGAILTGATLAGANLKEADCSGVQASKAIFAGAQAPGASFTGAALDGAVFEKAVLAGASFSGASLKGAKCASAVLTKAAFSGARAELADFTGSDLTGAYADAGADFKKALFVKAKGPQSVWESGILDGADFTGAVLVRANFSRASLRESKLVGVDAKQAIFRKARLVLARAPRSDFFESTFEKADLSGADFTGANLFGSDFQGSVLEGSRLEGANVKRTTLG